MKSIGQSSFIIFVVLFAQCHPVNCSWSELLGEAFELVSRAYVQIRDTLTSEEFADTSKQYFRWILGVAKEQRKKLYVTLNEIVNTPSPVNDVKRESKIFTHDYSISDPMYIQKFIGDGRRVENHVVRTKDGYLLLIHRLMLQDDSKRQNRSVILHHGLFGSSMDWFLTESSESLPLLLADAGCDVWLANARGNIYSRRHVFQFVSLPEFWKFSFQEMGEIDLPAVIDYIIPHQRHNSSISFVGHSMGATALLTMLSTLPHYNKKLEIGVLLAPLAFMGHATGPLKDLASAVHRATQQLSDGEIFASREVPEFILSNYLGYCNTNRLCKNPLFFACGGISRCKKEVDLDLVERLMKHVPAGASLRTILHYAQLVASGGFHKYGNSSAEFALKDVTLPIVIYSSTDDQIATVPDIDILYLSIANPVTHFVFRNECVSHTEFIWGENMSDNLYKNITKLLV